MKQDMAKIILIINVKELYNNNDSKKEKDLVENQGQEEEGMQDWRSVYKKFFVDLHMYVYLYSQFQKGPGQVEC